MDKLLSIPERMRSLHTPLAESLLVVAQRCLGSDMPLLQEEILPIADGFNTVKGTVRTTDRASDYS